MGTSVPVARALVAGLATLALGREDEANEGDRIKALNALPKEISAVLGTTETENCSPASARASMSGSSERRLGAGSPGRAVPSASHAACHQRTRSEST